MSKLIKIFLITLLALAVSCKSNENPDSGGEVAGENPPAGTYTGSILKGNKATVSADGTIEGELYYTSANQQITFKVKVNNWYRYSTSDTHYVKEGSYEVISFSPNNYTFANSSSSVISWRYLNGQAILYFDIDKLGFEVLTLN